MVEADAQDATTCILKGSTTLLSQFVHAFVQHRSTR